MESFQARPKLNAAGLIRGLGLWSAIAVIIGSMVGQAVFLVASDMARDLGSPERVIIVWVIVGIVVLFAAFCYAELGAAIPAAGGDYIYLTRGISPLAGFLFGWDQFDDHATSIGCNNRGWAVTLYSFSLALCRSSTFHQSCQNSFSTAAV